MLIHILILASTTTINADANVNGGYCDATTEQCYEENDFNTKKLLFYDVNPPEGFNLRRDVYMRFAIMLSEAQKHGKKTNWNLVLPPWYNLYHWRFETFYDKKPILWSQFFDIDSLKSYARVTELYEVFNNVETKKIDLDRMYILENFPDMFEDGEFREKWEISKDDDCYYNGEFWGYSNITAKEVICVRFQGKVSKIWELMSLHPKDEKVMIAHGEIALHDKYGTKEYWDCRKSMKFNKKLVNTAKNYMNMKFKCSEKCSNYISVHWRRQDFARSRSNDTPSIGGTAKQINEQIKQFNPNITMVYIATDASISELSDLVTKLQVNYNYQVLYFIPSAKQLKNYKDGGIAIIDQIICSHSVYFIGTHESTFTFRIQEEREILGYLSSATYNRLCPDSGPCEKPSEWHVVN